MMRIHSSQPIRQRGATLLVGMIMLVVLTLLVVFAIRSSNTGLQVAGNMQAQVEAAGAAQQAIEQVVDQLKLDTLNPAEIPAQPFAIQLGSQQYQVAVSKPVCEMKSPLYNSDLDLTTQSGKNCAGGGPPFVIEDVDGNPIPALTICSEQSWRIEAAASHANTGANVALTQGVSIRVLDMGGGQCP